MKTQTTISDFNGASTFTINGTSNSLWNLPERLEVNEIGDTIEMIYKETSMVTFTVYPSPPPQERIFKIVYSCKDGKWNKSERIYGREVKERSYYEFEIQ